jgi:hypothetical protein
MAIIVKDDRIEAVLPAAALTAQQTAGARVVDVSGQYLLPGLIDSHVHYATNPDRPYAEAELKRNIYGGVTGVRDMAGDARELAGLSRDALLNRIPSPDVFYASLVAGPSFFKDPRTVVAALGTQPGTVPWLYAVDDQTRLPLAVAQARHRRHRHENLRQPARHAGTQADCGSQSAGFPGLDPHAGLPCHALRFAGRDRRVPRLHDRAPCARSGQAAYGHGGEPSYEGLTAEDPGIKKYIAALAKSGTIMDATLSVYKTDGPHCHIELAGDITRAMHKAGIKIIAGTDTDNTGEDPFPVVDGELEKLVKYAGFTPQEAIIAATANAAQAWASKRSSARWKRASTPTWCSCSGPAAGHRQPALSRHDGQARPRVRARDYKFTPLPVHDD